jgi:hypothetical protein
MNIELNAVRVSCCSFCRIAGHRITACNDERIKNFETVMLYELKNIITIARTYNTSFSFIKREFIKWILQMYERVNKNILYAYAVRECGASSRGTCQVIINAIITKMNQYLNLSQEINLDENITRLINYLTFRSIQLPTIDNIEQEEEHLEQDGEEDEDLNQENVLLSIIDTRLQIEENRRNREIINNYIYQSHSFDLLLSSMTLDTLRNMDDSITNLRQYRNRKFDIKISNNELPYEDNICECNICYEQYEKKNYIKLNCEHEFCKECIVKTLEKSNTNVPCCAFCRKDMVSFELYDKSIESDFNGLINI